MSKKRFGSFTDLGSATESDPVDVSDLEAIYVVGYGTFVGTWELQFSMDGVSFNTHPTITGKTAAFSGAVGFLCKQVRIACTAWTSGTIESDYSGKDDNLLG